MSEIYHVLNRGVDKRKIFMDDDDRYRFIHDLFEFNDVRPVSNLDYRFKRNQKGQSMGVVNQYIERRPRKLLVELLAFCLMPNHYHLLLTPKADNGMPLFMKKLNTGYANYFNKKYQRSGALFQGRYKSVLVQKDSHFLHLPYYIHLNPLDLKFPEWRDGKLRNKVAASEFIEKYRWSSHLDYLGQKNFPSVTQREFLTDCFDDRGGYKKLSYGWLKKLKNLTAENFSDSTFTLE